MVAGEGVDVAQHRQRAVLVAGGVEDLQAGLALEQVHGLQVQVVDAVDLAGAQRAGAGGGVGNEQVLHRVEVGRIGLPVIRVAADHGGHARLELLQPVAAGADAGLPVQAAVGVGGADAQVVVADQVGEVGVAALQGHHHHVLAVRLHILDGLDDADGGRAAVLAAVVIERGDHVRGGEAPAVVELDPLAQLEGPHGGVGRGLPALRELAAQRAVGADLGEVVAQLPGADVDHVGVVDLARIQCVAGGAAGERLPEGAAAGGGLRGGEHGAGGGDGDAERGGLADEVAAADTRRREQIPDAVVLGHRRFLVAGLTGSGAVGVIPLTDCDQPRIPPQRRGGGCPRGPWAGP